ncbi:hypothetical protein yc1106_02380 [Curvularia clavata]|uniref:BRCT domain-containing protein n=1 Tax=Curvularia clavata TaxID=95742 RepID=A0A9Q8Z386_CURCL|nr:hypothetical protein yc1106_02380 [Curvularia clavata]
MNVDDASTPAPSSCNAGNNAGSRSRVTVPPGESTSASRQPAAPRRTFFDPWNSSGTGHQRAENRLAGSTSWRSSRNLKLGEQFKGGLHGGKRVADTVGAGSDGSTKGLRSDGQRSLAEVWGASKASKDGGKIVSNRKHVDDGQTCAQESDPSSNHNACEDTPVTVEKQLFVGLCFYLNGSTAPLVSDHKLKQMLSTHGATHSIALGRRTVTHVILGTVNTRGGAGGGLAATKIQKEIAKTGGKFVKFVNADWVLDSIKANRRLPELHYSPLRLAQQSQGSILNSLRK